MFPALLSTAEFVFRWLTHAAWQAGLLATVVLVLTWLLGSRLSPRWRFALWLVVFARLAVPLLPAAPWSVFRLVSVTATSHAAAIANSSQAMPRPVVDEAINLQQDDSRDPRFTHETNSQNSRESAGSPANGEVTAVSPRVSTVSLIQLAALIWLAGVAVLSLRLAANVLQLHRRQRHWQRIADPTALSVLRECSRELRLVRSVSLYSAPDNLGPATCGMIRPRIVLPQSLLKGLSPAELRLVLLHELVHVRRHDVLVDQLVGLITILHWFHPVAWVSRYFLRRERELACDAAVLDRGPTWEVADYGHVLLKTAESLTAPLPGAVGMFSGGRFSLLDRRIRLIAAHRRTTWMGLLFGSVLLAAVVLVGLTDAQSPSQNREALQQSSPPEAKSKQPAAPDADSVPATKNKASGKSQKSNATKPPGRTLPTTVFGRALDEQGRPVPGATVYLVLTNSSPNKTLGQATTDENGHYEFRDAPLVTNGASQEWLEDAFFQVFGKAPGRAYAWRGVKELLVDSRWASNGGPTPLRRDHDQIGFKLGDKVELDLTFPKPSSITGRFVDEGGQPIAGVSVGLVDLQYIDPAKEHEALGPWAPQQLRELLPEMLHTTSDADGRFELATMPPEIAFRISGSHPQYANFSLYASTAQQPLAEFAGHPLVKLPLELTLRSERTISLTITRADTGQPFVGVNVDARQEEGLASSAFGTSDKFGKAKLTLPPGKFNLRGSPPLGTDYIRTSQELTVAETPAEQAVELKMAPGCILVLKAVDVATGEPIPGVSFWQQDELPPRGRGGKAGRREVQLNTTHVSHPKTDKQGELRSVAIPGTRRYGVGWSQLPDGYEAADARDERQGRDVTLIGGQGQKLEFNLRQKPATSNGAKNADAVTAQPVAKKPEEATARVFPTTISGRALDKGDPLEGATICLVKTNCEVEKVYAETRTDADGRYEFANVPLESNGVGDWHEMAYFRVVGKAPGRAFAWRGMKNMFIDPAVAERAGMTGRIRATPDPRLTGFVRGEKIELDLEFQPAAPIAGRIVDAAGKPVVGVSVTLLACDRIDAEGNAAAEHENFKIWVWYQRKPAAFMPDQLSTKSDAEGKFELANAPASAVCCLAFGHVQYAPFTVYTSPFGNPPATHKNNPVAKPPLVITLQSQVSDNAAEKEKPTLEPAKAKNGEKAKAAAPEDEAAKQQIRNHPLSVAGKALDQNGQPIAGATIFLVATNNSPDKLIGQRTTGADGRYEFRNSQLPYYASEKKDDYEDGTFQVFGKAPGVGFAWHGMRFLHIDPRHRDENGKSLLISPSHGFFPDEAIDLDLIFQPAKPVRGRFMDDQGQPIQGVKVSLTNCDYLDTNGKEDNLAFREFRSAVRQAQQAMPDQLQCTSDADGRFEFKSVPQGIGCRLAMRHPEYGIWALYTATVDSPPQKFARADVVPLPIEMVRHKTRAISLQVRYADTREPVIGAHVGAYLQLGTNNDWGECDKQGKVSFKLPPGEYTAWAHPPQGADYLSVHAPIVVRPTEQEQSAELLLDRACVLLLKASDAATGAGVEKVNFWYEEESQAGKKWFVQSNDTTNDFPVTDAQGELRALVRPGTRRYGIGLNPLPENYRADNDDKTSGRVLTLPAGQTVTAEFLLRK